MVAMKRSRGSSVHALTAFFDMGEQGEEEEEEEAGAQTAFFNMADNDEALQDAEDEEAEDDQSWWDETEEKKVEDSQATQEVIMLLRTERDKLTAELAAERLKTKLWWCKGGEENLSQELDRELVAGPKQEAKPEAPSAFALAAVSVGLQSRLEAFLASSRRRLQEQHSELDELASHVALAAELASEQQSGEGAQLRRLGDALTEATGRLQSEEHRRSAARLEANALLRNLEICQSNFASSREEVCRLERQVEELRNGPGPTAAHWPMAADPLLSRLGPAAGLPLEGEVGDAERDCGGPLRASGGAVPEPEALGLWHHPGEANAWHATAFAGAGGVPLPPIEGRPSFGDSPPADACA